MKQIIDAQKYHLTYGEAIQLELDNLKMQDGKWQKTVEVINKPPRMQRKEAAQYYNKKMFLYFKERML